MVIEEKHVFIYSDSTRFKLNGLEKRSPRPLFGAELEDDRKIQLNQKVVWLDQNWDSRLGDRLSIRGDV